MFICKNRKIQCKVLEDTWELLQEALGWVVGHDYMWDGLAIDCPIIANDMYTHSDS